MNPTRVLVVDDLEIVARALAAQVRAAGHEVVVSHDVEDALAKFEAQDFDVVLSDVKMGSLGGFDLLRGIQERSSIVPVVLITAAATVESAMDAVEAGAFNYLSKPVHPEELRHALTHAIEHKRLRSEARDHAPLTPPAPVSETIRGRSPKMLQAFQTVARAAASDTTVLILGENGTGKELVARVLHERGPRAAKPFVPVNVATIVATLAESELFGHVKGAFTDARENRVGLFEQANGGTLFLDEIGDLPAGLQAKLLRAIQEHRIKPVGGTEEIEVDIRLVCATNRDLKAMVANREFRDDLYFRVRVIEIVLPPLRERTEDIGDLAMHFLGQLAARSGRPVPVLTPDALQLLEGFPWPGNVRELSNAIESAFALAQNNILSASNFQLGRSEFSEPHAGEAAPVPNGTSYASLQEKIDAYIHEVLEHTGGNITQAAKILGISRRTLQRTATRRRGSDLG